MYCQVLALRHQHGGLGDDDPHQQRAGGLAHSWRPGGKDSRVQLSLPWQTGLESKSEVQAGEGGKRIQSWHQKWVSNCRVKLFYIKISAVFNQLMGMLEVEEQHYPPPPHNLTLFKGSHQSRKVKQFMEISIPYLDPPPPLGWVLWQFLKTFFQWF